MGRVLGEIDEYDAKSYMPMREMHAKQHAEVYEAAAGYIALFLETGVVDDSYSLLVELDDGREVAFSCDVSDQMVDLQ